MEEIIRIPEDRIGVLIGHEGVTKRKIEKQTKAKIRVDSGVYVFKGGYCVEDISKPKEEAKEE